MNGSSLCGRRSAPAPQRRRFAATVPSKGLRTSPMAPRGAWHYGNVAELCLGSLGPVAAAERLHEPDDLTTLLETGRLQRMEAER